MVTFSDIPARWCTGDISEVCVLCAVWHIFYTNTFDLEIPVQFFCLYLFELTLLHIMWLEKMRPAPHWLSLSEHLAAIENFLFFSSFVNCARHISSFNAHYVLILGIFTFWTKREEKITSATSHTLHIYSWAFELLINWVLYEAITLFNPIQRWKCQLYVCMLCELKPLFVLFVQTYLPHHEFILILHGDFWSKETLCLTLQTSWVQTTRFWKTTIAQSHDILMSAKRPWQSMVVKKAIELNLFKPFRE